MLAEIFQRRYLPDRCAIYILYATINHDAAMTGVFDDDEDDLVSSLKAAILQYTYNYLHITEVHRL